MDINYNQKNKVPDFIFNNGLKFPSFGLGTLVMSNSKPGAEQKVVTSSIRDALSKGYRHFDTAIFYNNQKEMGIAFKEIFSEGIYKREDIFITTKIQPFKYWNAIDKLQESLKELQFTYVDLYLIHFPASPPHTKKKQIVWSHKAHHLIWGEMEECYKMGLTKSIGVSNFNVQSLVDILSFCQIQPANNQIEINPYYVPKGIIDFCKGGLKKVNTGLKGKFFDIFNEPILVQTAQKHNKTVAQVVLNYINKVLGCAVIPKSTNAERIAENINIFDFQLDSDDIKLIDSLNKMERTLDIKQVNKIVFQKIKKKNQLKDSLLVRN